MRQQFTPDVTTWFLVVVSGEYTVDAVASGIQRQQFIPDDLPGSWLLSAACGLRANGDHGIWHHNMVFFGNVWLDNMVFVEVVLLDVFVVLVEVGCVHGML